MPQLRLLTTPAQRSTHYERHGYTQALASLMGRETQCRVASVPVDSWRCRKHNRSILHCLNERAEAERLALRALVHAT